TRRTSNPVFPSRVQLDKWSLLIFSKMCRSATQRQASAAVQARLLRLHSTPLARGAYPEAAKPLSAANDVGWLYGTQDFLPENQNHDLLDTIIARACDFDNGEL
ncbi:MAG: hypothetical protein DDG60_13350, partial [Anaerolineae bacterium]